MYYKGSTHMEETRYILEKLGRASNPDREYYCLAYLFAASGKTRSLIHFMDEEGVDVETLLEAIKPYSEAEKGLIRFGLQLFNNSIDDIKLGDVMSSLDAYNNRAVIEAITVRFSTSHTAFKELYSWSCVK